MKEVNPYDKLASIYDQLMDHVDYKMWALYILDIIDRLNFKIDKLIDLSCGTGSFLEQLKDGKRDVWGSDRSLTMIKQAKGKLIDVSLFVNDIRDIALKDNSVEGVFLLYDSINYLLDEKDISKAMQEIRRIVKSGGLFIFDVVSEMHCIEHYNDYQESEYWDHCGYTRHSYFDHERKIQYNNFRIVIKGKTFFEKHVQKIYSTKYFSDKLTEHSFEIINIFDEFSFEKAKNGSGRLHFVCQCKQK